MNKDSEFRNPPFSGLSTKWEVEQLMDKFGNVSVGTVISDDEIAEACKMSSSTDLRFRTVTNSWRKKMFKEKNILVERKRKEGFVISSNSNRVDYSSRKLSHIKRENKKVFSVSSRTSDEGLDESQKSIRQFQVMASSRMTQAFKEEENRFKIEPPKSVKQIKGNVAP